MEDDTTSFEVHEFEVTGSEGRPVRAVSHGEESAPAVPCIEALSELARGQLGLKRELPTAWFRLESLAEKDRDLRTLDPAVLGVVVCPDVIRMLRIRFALDAFVGVSDAGMDPKICAEGQMPQKC